MSTKSNKIGRQPPPPASRYKTGRSGNPRGRPKGAVSLKLITEKIALKRLTQTVDGKQQSRTILEWVILTLRAMQMEGNSGAAVLMEELRNLVEPPAPEGGGFVIVPEVLNEEEAMAMIERYNAEAVEPGTEEYERQHPWTPKVGPGIDPTTGFDSSVVKVEQ